MQLTNILRALNRSRTGPVLLAAQIAIALTVLVNSAYLIGQQWQMNRRPTGMDTENIFWVMSTSYGNDFQQGPVVRSDLAYLNALPGVIAAAASHSLPETMSRTVLGFSTEPEMRGRQTDGLVYLMTGRAVDALGLKLVAGRSFDAGSVAEPASDFNQALSNWAPEIIVTQAFANSLFEHGDAVGKTVYVDPVRRSCKVIGVVARMQAFPIGGPEREGAERVVLVPATPPGPGALYIVRTQPGRLDALMARVERELESQQPRRFVNQIEALATTAQRIRAPARASSVILSIVALFVVAVTAVSIFGLAAFNVVRRIRQIGTRRALGARRSHILSYFLLENWLITTAGVLVGCILALAVGVKLSEAYQLPRFPLMYLVGGVVSLWVVALLAAFAPAHRAAAIPPAVATRLG